MALKWVDRSGRFEERDAQRPNVHEPLQADRVSQVPTHTLYIHTLYGTFYTAHPIWHILSGTFYLPHPICHILYGTFYHIAHSITGTFYIQIPSRYPRTCARTCAPGRNVYLK